MRTNRPLKLLKRQGGFSLLELMLVLAISGGLVTIIFFAFHNGQVIRRDNQRKEALQLIANNLDKLKDSTNYSHYYPWNTVKQGGVSEPVGICTGGVSCFRWFFDATAGNGSSSFYGIPNDTDPLSGTRYRYLGHDDASGTDETNLVLPTATTPATIYYRMGWPCGAAAGDGDGDSGFNAGVYRLTISLEDGGRYCLDNH